MAVPGIICRPWLVGGGLVGGTGIVERGVVDLALALRHLFIVVSHREYFSSRVRDLESVEQVQMKICDRVVYLGSCAVTINCMDEERVSDCLQYFTVTSGCLLVLLRQPNRRLRAFIGQDRRQ